MSGLAAVALNHAVVASPGTTFLPGLAPTAVAGFAVGTLLSALCVLGVMAQRRHSRWQRRAARMGVRATAPQRPDAHEALGSLALAAEGVAAEVGACIPAPATVGTEPRSEVRRSAGRHAAPPASASSRMSIRRASR
jgi:hypothetical protein